MNLNNVVVVEHDPNWSNLFLKEETIFRESIFKNESSSQLVNIYHCGSTSVKYLKAKPVIDIILVVFDIEHLDSMQQQFTSNSYEPKGENGIPKRRFFTKRVLNSIWVNVHAFQYDNITDIERHLLFRDYLSNNETVRNEYSQLKSDLAVKFPNSLSDYWEGKNEWVKEHEKKSLLWHWSNRFNNNK